MNLFEIKKEYEDALDNLVVDEETGEIDTTMINSIEGEITEKMESIMLYIKGLKAEAKAIGDEMDSMKKRKTVAENKAERLSQYLIDFIEVTGGKFKTPKVQASIRHSVAVDIVDEDKIPDFYKVPKTTYQISKAMISESIKSGVGVPGAALKENKSLIMK